MTALLPTHFDARSGSTQSLQLVPMGAARLRITAFPQTLSTDKVPGGDD